MGTYYYNRSKGGFGLIQSGESNNTNPLAILTKQEVAELARVVPTQAPQTLINSAVG